MQSHAFTLQIFTRIGLMSWPLRLMQKLEASISIRALPTHGSWIESVILASFRVSSAISRQSAGGVVKNPLRSLTDREASFTSYQCPSQSPGCSSITLRSKVFLQYRRSSGITPLDISL